MKETKPYLIQIKNEIINNLKESQSYYNKTFFFCLFTFISIILLQTLLQVALLVIGLTFLLIYNNEMNHYKMRLVLFDLLQGKTEEVIVPKKVNRFFPNGIPKRK